MSEMVRVKDHWFVQTLGDTKKARVEAEVALREKGCTIFRHTTGYSLQHDQKVLRSEGFVVEAAT